MSAGDVGILLGSLLFVGLALLAMARWIPHTARVPQNDVAGFVFAVVGVLYAVLLAFVVIAVWENTDAAKATTFKEADSLAGVYWMARQLPMPLGGQLEDQTLRYAHAVVDDEWKAMVDHQSDRDATMLMYDIRNTALSFQPTTAQQTVLYTQTMADVQELASQRRARLSEIEDLVPTLLWIALIAGGLLTVAFAFLFGLSNTWSHLVMVLTLTALVVLSLITVNEMDYPFKGVNAVKPTAFEVFLTRLPPERQP